MARRKTRGAGDENSFSQSTPTNWVDESEALQPVSKDTHPDAWPCFVLKDAIVCQKNGQTVANLLHAELDGPFIIRGKLEVDKEFRHLLRASIANGTAIEIKCTRGYSMGIGPVTIWADGGAGWFEIRPAATYQKIYDKMSEGVALYFFLTDLYEDLREAKKTKRITTNKALDVEHIFDLYIQQSTKHLSRADMVQIISDHALFLLSQMRKPREPVLWGNTTFYRYLIQNFPDLADRFLRNANSSIQNQTVAKTTSNTVTHQQQDAILVPSLPPKSPITSKRAKNNVVTILRTIDDMQQSMRFRGQNLSLRMLCQKLCKDFNLVSDDLAIEVIRYYGKDLLPVLEAKLPDSMMLKDVKSLTIKPSRASSSTQYEAGQVVLTASTLTTNDITTKAQAIRTSRGTRWSSRQSFTRGKLDSEHKMNSALSPGTLFQHSYDPKASPASEMDVDEEPDEKFMARRTDTTHLRRSRRGRPSRSGKAAALRLVGTPVVHRDMSSSPSDSETTDTVSQKRRKLSKSPSDDVESGFEDVKQRYDQEESSKENIEAEVKPELKLAYDLLLSDSHQQPSGLWVCQNDGCEYTVLDAQEKEGRAKVHEHFLLHADEIVARENLVLQERRPHLPINNLLEKLRSLGEAARLAEYREIDGRVLPAPIKRQMIA